MSVKRYRADEYDAMVKRLSTHCDGLVTHNDRLVKERDALQAENALLRDVVEAAEMEMPEPAYELAPGEHPGPLRIALDTYWAWKRSKDDGDV